ncbi:zinc finger protein 687 [Xenopus tropicalis]|uniref:Zinc finger protein 687 n=1 Tax=Xenopus tropicalis TaxID=8364 RepID=A0JP81_XENTR|nr:zinc finger protein 687 [Xenopus tropicalis]AAI27288.1 znf687 protein [Xenopus tropicalis]|eukprot:NP_001090655.1 zinc finger protein 687 [Xenopus tropicalis]
MGDMKTPDFDDLLAAFDIPDVDTNEAINSGPEDEEGQVKSSSGESSDPGVPHGDITAVSVIVKNTVCPDQADLLESHGKDPQATGPRLLQNGFNSPDVGRSSALRSMDSAPTASNGGEGWPARLKGPKPIELFTDFSAVDNPMDGHAADLIDRPRDVKPKDKALFEPADPVLCSPSGSVVGESSHGSRGAGQTLSIAKLSADSASFGLAVGPPPSIKQEPEDDTTGNDCAQGEELARECSLEHLKSVSVLYPSQEPPLPTWSGPEKKSEAPMNSVAPTKSPSSHPMDTLLPSSPPPEPNVEGSDLPKEPKTSSAIEAPGLKEEPGWSPKSLSSDVEEDESISSPSSNSSRPLKVRIKTIKTQSGSITRTVTRVSSDSNAVSANPTKEDSPPEAGSEPSSEKSADAKEEVVPPAEKGSELSSPTKAEPSQAAKAQPGNGTPLKGSVLPVSTIQNASSVMLMAASVAQQKAVVLPSKANNVMTKNIIHLVQQQPLANTATLANVTVANQVPPGPTVTTTPSPQRSATVVMVQPQKAAPAMAGTVISRTQSSLVETFNKILNSKNLLPTYKPNLSPPADSSLTLPVFGFRCLECGDSFALEKSLARHYDRRSMRIEVTCNHCTKRLVFFNKCSLLLHARKHKDNGLVMQCSHLVMRPIALEQMIGQPDVTPLVSVAVLTPGKTATPGPAQDAAATASTGGDSAILPGNGASEQSVYSTFRCLECKEQCKNKTGLALHFQQAIGSPASGSTICSLCPMMMPNRCSFEAHQRMHKQAPPHVCPECGGNFRMENFQAHLKETCLHYSRRIGYKCQSCAVVFGGVNSIKSHIQTSHCEVFHKCPICPMAFKSAPSAHAHIYNQHPGFSNQQAKMIYKCAMCDTVFTHKPLLCSHLDHSHFDQQLGNQRVSVFKCPDCPLLFAQKRTMLEHLKNTHNSVVREDPPSVQEPLTPKPEPVEIPVSKLSEPAEEAEPELEPPPEPEPEMEDSSSSEPPSSPEPRKKGGAKEQRKADGPRQRSNCWTCGICHSWFPERDEYVTHMKKEHGKSVKKFPCRLCERSFCSAPSLRRHVRVNHEGIKRVYPCRYCTEGKRTFSSRLILEKHIQVRHGIKITDQARSQEISVSHISQKSQETSSKKRKLSSDDSGSDDSPKAKHVPQKPKRPFQCRACGYKTSSLADFRQHIPQHRTDESAHQCRECGVCFTSQGSLNRHRIMTHKMKGAAAEEEEPEAPQKVEEGPDGKLTCQVCNKSFDSQLNLNTHFRTHGMAFIKQRQSGGTEN